MLTSICPLGERARHQPYALTVVAYVGASGLAGALLGGALGAVGAFAGGVLPSLDAHRALALVAIATAAGLVADVASGDRPLPGPARQVDEDWLVQYRGWVYGAGFGLQLGTGVVTYVVVSATYVVWVCALLTLSAAAGAVLGGTYGLVRALGVLATADVRDGVALRTRMAVLHRWRPIVHRALLVVQAAIAVAAVAVLVVRWG